MAKKSIGLLNIVFGADLRGFERAMKKAQRSVTKFGNKMGNIGKKLTTNVTLPIIGLGAAAVKMAADFEETDSKFKTVFSSIQKQAEDTAKTFKESFGLSEKAAKQLLSDTGDLLVGFGFTEQAALDLSKNVNELAVDLASFTNFSGGAEGASLALTKALLGERESIKSLGIAITEADLKSFAAEQGLVWKELDRITKANLTFQLAMKQSSKAVGDYSRTSGSLTNQSRALGFAIQDLSVEFGTILIPLAKSLVSALKDVVSWVSDLSLETKEGIVKWAGYVAVLGPVVIGVSKIILAFSYLLPWIHKIGKAIVWLGAKMLTMIKRNPWLLIATAVVGVGVAIADAMGAFDKWLGKTDDIADSGEEAAGSVKKLTKELKDLDKELDKPKPTGKGKGLTPIPSLGPTLMPVEEGGPIGSVGAAIADILRKQEQLNAATALFGDIMHNAMMDAANSQEGFFQSLFENIKKAITQLLIQLAVLTAINIMLGGRGITGVEAFANAKNTLLGLQHGGLATGPTLALVGEGAGTSISNPEVIAPLDQLKNYMGGDMRVTGRLVGNDIFLSNEKAGVSRNRFV
tara:strand:+ start:5394 stop:7121 length:1728 start_codon:yes stop_codon:yes gene_type:complete